MRMRRLAGLVLVIFGGMAAVVRAAEESATPVVSAVQPARDLGASVRNEVDAAVLRGLNWLADQQRTNGVWSSEEFPAITGLGLWAFAKASHPRRDETVRRAVAFIRSCVQENGGIYRDQPGKKGGGLSNYNTAICMTALHRLGDPALVPVIQKARAFVASSQCTGGDTYDGGFGYDGNNQRPYADLLNTYYSVVAMRETADVEDLRPAGEKRVDIDWARTVRFIEKMQNTEAAGVEQDGGFFYKPGESKSGVVTNAEGAVVFRSYGSMTYAGLLALIYADVARDDARVRSAFDWSRNHWSLKENPGMGDEGLFYFYNVLTKSLDAYGQDSFMVKGQEEPVRWRRGVAEAILSHMKTDAKTGGVYWQNANGRFWESDPVLSTAYMLAALQQL